MRRKRAEDTCHVTPLIVAPPTASSGGSRPDARRAERARNSSLMVFGLNSVYTTHQRLMALSPAEAKEPLSETLKKAGKKAHRVARGEVCVESMQRWADEHGVARPAPTLSTVECAQAG